VAIFRTQVALQKRDFWLRNPDYLAEFLLDTPSASALTSTPKSQVWMQVCLGHDSRCGRLRRAAILRSDDDPEEEVWRCPPS